MTQQSFTIRPGQVAEIEFDLRTWVADRVAEGHAANTLVFELRASAGLTVSSTSPEIGLINVEATSTQIGRVFDVGIEARAPDGDSFVDMRKVRVRDPSPFELLPEEQEAVLTPLGDILVDPLGNTIVSP